MGRGRGGGGKRLQMLASWHDKNEDFLPCVRERRGGTTLTKNLAMLKHPKGISDVLMLPNQPIPLWEIWKSPHGFANFAMIGMH